MDVLLPRPTRTLCFVWTVALLSSHYIARAVHPDAPRDELISSSELEQSYFAERFVLDDLSLEQAVADDLAPPAPPKSAPAPVTISMRPSLWTGAVTMLLLIPVFGRFRRRLLV